MRKNDIVTYSGQLTHIHTTGKGRSDMVASESARLVAGIGIPGDRYAERTGTYSERHHIDRQITLIEQETLDALARDTKIELLPQEHRRNLTTVGVPLNHLVGQYFVVGEAVLFGGRLNVPCNYLQDLLGKRVFRPLIHRSGLNARVIVDGTIRVGDAIKPVDVDDLAPDLVAANAAHGVEPAPEVG